MPSLVSLLRTAALSGLALGPRHEQSGQPYEVDIASGGAVTTARPAPFCFPALGFEMPLFLPKDNTDWWCDPATEYAFVGFSYEVTACELTIPSNTHL